MSKVLWKGKSEDLPQEYSDKIVGFYNKRIQWLNDNPDKWHSKEEYPYKYHFIKEPFELCEHLGYRPYLTQEAEVTEVKLDKEKV